MATAPRTRKGDKRPPPALTHDYLHEQARLHLLRFEPTVSQMRRVLMRRVDRCVAFHGGSRDDGGRLVTGVLRDLVERGWIDDERVARGWTETLHRRGVSRRALRARLLEKGLDRDLVDRCIAALADEGVDPDLSAAVAYARRRRFGPFRGANRAERRDRDLAAMARAGFSFGVCFRVIDAPDPDVLP